MTFPNSKIAIIGAGMTAAAAVRKLRPHGATIDVFEKSRGAGGRIATRRLQDGITADHGAQYFTAKSAAFKNAVASWEKDGLVAQWDVHDGRHCYIGTPAMNSPVKHEVAGAALHASTHVTQVEWSGRGWRIVTENGDFGDYDYVISTVPAPQAGPIIGAAAPGLVSAINGVDTAPCWALMLVFDAPLESARTHWRGQDDIAGWIACNSRKAGRSAHHSSGQNIGHESWTVHATPGWSTRFLEAEATHVAHELYAAFKRLMELNDLPAPRVCTAHRWRYAQTVKPLGQAFLSDPTDTLFVGGDWCLGARVENAFESGDQIAGAIIRTILKAS